MSLLTVCGEAASGWEEVAHATAQLLGFELVTEARLAEWIAQEFGSVEVPARAWRSAAALLLARIAKDHHLVIAVEGCENLFPALPLLLRVRISAPETYRTGKLMIEDRLERPAATARLAKLEAEQKHLRRRRFGSPAVAAHNVDLNLRLDQIDVAQAAEMLAAAVSAWNPDTRGLLGPQVADQIQFDARIQLAKYGLAPAGRAGMKRTQFGHPSEQMFANLLDFYRVQWQYEPRSFPLQWDKDGNVIEAFTPDFYLPQFDLYIELTTMKQSLVTRKNRKIKLLRAIYPHVNIQVFYQKDFQDLVIKYGWRAS